VHGVGTNSITVRHCASGAIAWHIPRAHQLVIRDLRWSGDSRHFLSAGADKNAIIWDIATRTNLAPFEHPEPVYHAELNSTGTMLLTACRDKHARLWNVANGALIHRLPHSRSVASARFNGDGSLAVTVSDDGVVRIWDLSTGGLFSEPLRLVGWPGDARFTSDDKHVEVAMDDGTSRVFKIGRFFSHPAPDPSPGTEVQPLMTVESHGVRAMASGNIVELLNTRSGKGKLIHESTVNCVRFSSDGRRIATSTSGRRARVWDVHTGQALTDWLESKYPVPSIWFSSDDQWLLSSDNCWELHVMDGPAPAWLPDLAEAVAGEKTGDRRVSGPATAIAFTRLGQRLAALPSTNRLVAWAKEFVSDDFETRPR